MGMAARLLLLAVMQGTPNAAALPLFGPATNDVSLKLKSLWPRVEAGPGASPNSGISNKSPADMSRFQPPPPAVASVADASVADAVPTLLPSERTAALTARPPVILPTPFLQEGLEMSCSWVIRPDGIPALFYTTDTGLCEVHLLLDGAEVRWSPPLPSVRLPTFNGTKASIPRGLFLPVPTGRNDSLPHGTAQSTSHRLRLRGRYEALAAKAKESGVSVGHDATYRYGGVIGFYPEGIAGITATWDTSNTSLDWDMSPPRELVWRGANGGGVRHVIALDIPGENTHQDAGLATCSRTFLTISLFSNRARALAAVVGRRAYLAVCWNICRFTAQSIPNDRGPSGKSRTGWHTDSVERDSSLFR